MDFYNGSCQKDMKFCFDSQRGNSLKMNKIDRNMLDLWQVVSEKYNFNIST